MTKKQKISLLIVFDLFFILLSLFSDFILNHYPNPSYFVSTNSDYIYFPFRDFLKIISPANFLITIIVIALSVSDFYSKISNYTDFEPDMSRNIFVENTFDTLNKVLMIPSPNNTVSEEQQPIFINRHNQVNYSNSCPKCGNQIMYSDKFCQKCGYNL